MSNKSAISSIIQEINKNQITESRNKSVIFFDTEQKRIVDRPKKGLKSVFTKQAAIKYYSITHKLNVELSIPNLLIHDFASGIKLELDVSCQISIEEFKDLQSPLEIFLSLAQDHENLKRTFDLLVEEAIAKYISRQESKQSFILNYYESDNQKQLIRSIQAHLYAHGFSSEIRVKPSREKYIEENKHRSGNGHLAVKFTDYDKPLDITYNYQLSGINNKRIRILVFGNQPEKLHGIIKSKLREKLETYSLNVFINDQEKKIISEFINDSKNLIASYGYELNVSLAYNHDDLPDTRSEELSHTVHCTIRNYEDKIEINNRILFKITDYASYLQTGIEDPREWIKDKLDDLCKKYLFDKTYLDVVFDKELSIEERMETHIIKEMAQCSKIVGFTINQHFILPALEPLVLKEEGLHIDNTGEYASKNGDIKIKVQLILDGRIRDLRKVQSYIESKVDLKAKIQERAIKAIESKLHTVDPESALLFNMLGQHQARDEKTCEELIIEAIRNTLHEFDLDPLDITLKAEESELKRRLKTLTRGTREVFFDVETTRIENGAEKISYMVEYKIFGVDPEKWFVFHNDRRDDPDDEIQAIQNTLTNDLISKLQTVPMEFLRFTDFKVATKLKETVVEPARKKIAEVYGLIVQIINFKREASISEKRLLEYTETETENLFKNRKDALELAGKHKLNELDDLYKERKELEYDNENGTHDKAINKINKRIANISGTEPSYNVEKILPKKAGKEAGFSFEDFNENPDPTKRIEEANEAQTNIDENENHDH